MKKILLLSVMGISLLLIAWFTFATPPVLIDMKICSHLDVPTNTVAFLGNASPDESCSVKYRDKIEMLDHHTTGMVTTKTGTRFVVNYLTHIDAHTKEHDPAVCVVVEEILQETGM